MKTKKLHMIGNAHIDPVWLWQWQEGFHEVKATFRSALDRLTEYPDFVFVASSAAFYAWVEKSDPAMFAEIQRRVAEGRWDLVGGWWVEPDCNIPSGESFARHSLYGQRYFKEKFGKTARTGFNVDSFGHAATLPQILKKSGIDYYTFLRPAPHERELPSRLFWWEADDGSRVLAFRIPFAYCMWSDDVAEHALQCAAETSEPADEIMSFYGVGNHGGGPTIANLESIRRLDADENFPLQLAFSTPEAYFESALQKGWPIPLVHEELLNHAKGCYSVHSGIKAWNREAENRLAAAEKWSLAAAWMLGRDYPHDFAHAWKQVLFNQFHDILAGTSLAAAYTDSRNAFGEALAIAGRNLNEALQAIAWEVRIPQEDGARPLIVFNPLTWRVRANVELESPTWPAGARLVDDEGQLIAHQAVQSSTATGRVRLSFMADLPALGYRTYRLLTAGLGDLRVSIVDEAPAALDGEAGTAAGQANDTMVENRRFRLELDPRSGAIAGLRDKVNGWEVFSGPAARAMVLDDPSDTWSHDVAAWDQVVGEFGDAKVRLVEHGPVKSVLRAVSHYGASSLVQDFTLAHDCEYIDVRVQVDWREQYKLLKLRFPLNTAPRRVVRDIAYGSAETTPNGDEYPFQQWVDVAGAATGGGETYGLSLCNDGKYSLDVRGSDIGLTVLRSPAYAHHVPAKLLPGGLYPYIDQGIQVFHYRLLPHRGEWESAGTARRSQELNQPPSALFATFHPQGSLPGSGAFIAVEPENVLVSVLKQAEDGADLILRAVELNKTPVRARIQLPGRVIEADFVPGEIKTLRVPRDPARPVTETNLLEE